MYILDLFCERIGVTRKLLLIKEATWHASFAFERAFTVALKVNGKTLVSRVKGEASREHRLKQAESSRCRTRLLSTLNEREQWEVPRQVRRSSDRQGHWQATPSMS